MSGSEHNHMAESNLDVDVGLLGGGYHGCLADVLRIVSGACYFRTNRLLYLGMTNKL